MLEKTIEGTFCNHVNKLGYNVIKIQAKIGWPDRIVALANGYHFYIEFKAPGKKPRKIQLHVHDILRLKGHHVYVCDNLKDAKDILEKELQYFKENFL